MSDPYMAVLSVIVHGSEGEALVVATNAALALGQLDAEVRRDYLMVIWSSLSEPLRDAFRSWIMAHRVRG